MITGNQPLIEALIHIIREKGKITFEEFMGAALYHPEYGYYTSNRNRIGKEGDYYTSTDVHRAFGACTMRQVEEMAGILQMRSAECGVRNERPVNLVEVGAGKGLLCADILISAREKSPPLFDSLRYFIVEKSPDFIERQKRHIERLGLLDKVSWVPDIKEALSPPLSLWERVKGEGGVGIILSNELIDAFPVHKVRYSKGHWQEIYVTAHNGKLVEVEGGLSNKALAAFLSALSLQPSALEDGYTTEVNLRAAEWIKEVGNALKTGFVITIDYGYPRVEFYSPERNRGTLMCYFKHQAVEDPYVNIGEQDMTAHVDFTSLAEAGKDAALEVTGFTEQSYFLMGCGIEEEFQQIDTINTGTLNAFTDNITLKKLLMPGGMGSAFKILIQRKGIERPRLRGVGFRDLAKYL